MDSISLQEVKDYWYGCTNDEDEDDDNDDCEGE